MYDASLQIIRTQSCLNLQGSLRMPVDRGMVVLIQNQLSSTGFNETISCPFIADRIV